jgi:hypothetical protein
MTNALRLVHALVMGIVVTIGQDIFGLAFRAVAVLLQTFHY